MSNNGSNTLTRGLSVLGKLFVGSRKGPSGERVRSLKKLQKRIGVRFTDLSLLEQALTHRSYSHVTSQTRNDSNERMEFLGDSVLGLAVSQFLYLEFPDRSEGALSKMKSLLVSRKVLSTVSRIVGLGEYLLLSGEESDMGGRDRTSILADSFEGLIGAIYLDQGYRSANLFIRRTLLSDINEILKDEEHTNYKSLLQEYVQSRRLSHPVYRVRREEGPEHEKEFAVDVIVRGEPWGSGRGKSKKDAEQNAARAALEQRQEKPPRSASRDAAEARRRGRRGEGRESREGRTARPARKAREAAEAPPTRPRGDHGIAASRERLRAQRSEAPAERRAAPGESRKRRVSDRPVRERISREPRPPREPREPRVQREPRGPKEVREREAREPRVPREVREPREPVGEAGEVRASEEPARRRRRRRGSRGGAGRSASGEVAAREEDRPRRTEPRDEAPVRSEERPEPPREHPARSEERPESPREHPARSEEQREPRSEEPARSEDRPEPRSEQPTRSDERPPEPKAEPDSDRAIDSGGGFRGRGRRRAPRPGASTPREPAASATPEPRAEPDRAAPEDVSELTPAGGGSDFARRRKRVVRGFRKR